MYSTQLLAFSWTSGYGLVITIATAITLIGGAATILVRSGLAAARWWKPRPPLVAFGHPSENSVPFIFFMGGSDADWERQMRQNDEIRLKSLTISYLIENKDRTAGAGAQHGNPRPKWHGELDARVLLRPDSCSR